MKNYSFKTLFAKRNYKLSIAIFYRSHRSNTKESSNAGTIKEIWDSITEFARKNIQLSMIS